MKKQSKRLLYILLISTILLLIPFIANQLTDEVNWTSFDYVIAGLLIFGTGLTYEAIMRGIKSENKRFGLIIVLLIVVSLIWLELAVGIFGTPLAGN